MIQHKSDSYEICIGLGCAMADPEIDSYEICIGLGCAVA